MILPVVILYNADYYSSNVYNSLLRHYPNHKIVLYDNSPSPINCKFPDNTFYYHDIHNGGVSGGYNYAASIAAKMGGVEALLLLDQDTRFSSDYLGELERLLEEMTSVNIFVPKIYYNGNIPFSPVIRNRFRSKEFKSGIYSFKDYFPVNSGSCIRLKCFLDVGGYNTEIRLDFSDYDFFSRVGEKSEEFYVVDSKAQQNFSNNEKDSVKLRKRFCIFVEGGKVAIRNKLIRWNVMMGMIRHTIALCVRTRSFYYVLYLIKQFI